MDLLLARLGKTSAVGNAGQIVGRSHVLQPHLGVLEIPFQPLAVEHHKTECPGNAQKYRDKERYGLEKVGYEQVMDGVL